MSTQQHSCITIACDVCGEGLDLDEFGTPHFSDLAEAVGCDERWLITETEQLCPTCRCKRDGHGEGYTIGDRAWCERCDEPVGGEQDG